MRNILKFRSFAKALRYSVKYSTTLKSEYDFDGVLWYAVTPHRATA